MGAASSSDGSPPEELSTRLSTWASSEGSAAALAALDTAAPALSAALRASDTEALMRALGGDAATSNDDADDEAADPLAKRPRVTASFVRAVLDNERNASKVSSRAGARCCSSRRSARGRAQRSAAPSWSSTCPTRTPTL